MTRFSLREMCFVEEGVHYMRLADVDCAVGSGVYMPFEIFCWLSDDFNGVFGLHCGN